MEPIEFCKVFLEDEEYGETGECNEIDRIRSFCKWFPLIMQKTIIHVEIMVRFVESCIT